MLQTRTYDNKKVSPKSATPNLSPSIFPLNQTLFSLQKENQFSTIPYLDQFYYSPSSPELPGDQKYDCFGYRQIEEHCTA